MQSMPFYSRVNNTQSPLVKGMLCMDPRYIYICIFLSIYPYTESWKLTKIQNKIALIPYHHRFSQTELFGFIFPTIVGKTILINHGRENETKKFGLGKPAVIWDYCDLWA